MGNYGGSQVGVASNDCVSIKAEAPMERAVKRIEEEFKMLNDGLDRLAGRLSPVSSDKPATPTGECGKQPAAHAPLVEFMNMTADKIVSIRGRINYMLERLDI